MTNTRPRRGPRALCALLSLALAAPLPMSATAAERTIRCDSHGSRYNYCRVDTDNHVELTEKHSLSSCTEGRSWGYDARGVWVDRGCSADFRVGRGGHHNDKALLGAVVGLAALAALASSRHKQEAHEVAPWLVGSFKGMDEREGVEVELTILPGGKLNGRAGEHAFSGTVEGDRVQAGRRQFRIERQGNGFLAVDAGDDGYRVLFVRVGSGY
ncbi:conserved exported hypothetical protein [Rubrivivax sp. A210]|uniref:DUF3011 domain-containing protein n=1 Tax=Rubrivivax sp. A210 TaxID=2772301 RepID=UPI00191B4153|nr:DUF3011 domain-containing protein [Rubrivivax sp. A210]CAD5367139.1 conserved exported hypothetical protein [Rubrivivax sp. A210]